MKKKKASNSPDRENVALLKESGTILPIGKDSIYMKEKH